MFGRQRAANGILIQPRGSVDNTESFVDSIWPSVEAANEHAPQHSRLQKSLLVVVDLRRPLPLTPKGSSECALRASNILLTFSSQA